MAAADGNRVWFPEMIETLRSRWNVAMPLLVLIELCNIVDGMFQRRRPRGPILRPGSRCPECGRIVGSEGQQRHSISVRATIWQEWRAKPQSAGSNLYINDAHCQ